MTTRERLIYLAAQDNADEGTQWMERMEAWLDDQGPLEMDPSSWF